MRRSAHDIAEEWYSVREIAHSIQHSRSMSYEGTRIPEDVYSQDFAEFLTGEYRSAMAKGIQMAREEHGELKAENERLTQELEGLKYDKDDDLLTLSFRLDGALNELRCPECGCADQVDAESSECGCDAPLCARTNDDGTLAQHWLKLKDENERLAGERDSLARALFVIRSLTMRGKGDETIANIAIDALMDIDEAPLFQLKQSLQPREGEDVHTSD